MVESSMSLRVEILTALYTSNDGIRSESLFPNPMPDIEMRMLDVEPISASGSNAVQAVDSSMSDEASATVAESEPAPTEVNDSVEDTMREVIYECVDDVCAASTAELVSVEDNSHGTMENKSIFSRIWSSIFKRKTANCEVCYPSTEIAQTVDVALLEDISESSASGNAETMALNPSIVSTDVSESDHRVATNLVETKPIADGIIETATETVQAIMVSESSDEVIVTAAFHDDNDYVKTKKKSNSCFKNIWSFIFKRKTANNVRKKSSAHGIETVVDIETIAVGQTVVSESNDEASETPDLGENSNHRATVQSNLQAIRKKSNLKRIWSCVFKRKTNGYVQTESSVQDIETAIGVATNAIGPCHVQDSISEFRENPSVMETVVNLISMETERVEVIDITEDGVDVSVATVLVETQPVPENP